MKNAIFMMLLVVLMVGCNPVKKEVKPIEVTPVVEQKVETVEVKKEEVKPAEVKPIEVTPIVEQKVETVEVKKEEVKPVEVKPVVIPVVESKVEVKK